MRAVSFEALSEAEYGRAGGKAAGLARLLREGFPVPRGWAVFGEPFDAGPVLEAWRAAGSPAVAVRSSAACEDGAAGSFAGQFRTILGIRGEAAISSALREVLDSQAGTTAYGAGAGSAAAVVQEMVEPEAAGVAFGRDPAGGEGVVLEAVAGRGEALVSGRATPERWRVTAGGVDGEGRLLARDRIREIAASVLEIGRRLGGPQDVEWAVAGGTLWILQARPALPTAATILADLRKESPRETAWSAHNLAETLPAPTPISWAFVRRMMSWEGGYGRAFRALGFSFDEEARREGFLALVAGRLYVDLGREAGTYFGGFPLGYDLEAMRRDPTLALHPVPKPDWRRAPPGFWPRLPWHVWRMIRSERLIRRALREFPAEFDLWEADVKARAASAARAATVADFLDRFERVARETAEVAIRASLLAGYVFQKAGVEERKGLRTWIPEEVLHRGPGEMDLANPRWRELGATASPDQASFQPGANGSAPGQPGHPTQLGGSTGGARAPARPHPIYSLRERGKDTLMRETEVLRQDLLEIGRRTGLGDDIFFLYPEELDGPDPAIAARRRREREALLRIALPPLVFSRGEPPAASGSGTGLSPGKAQGAASLPARPEGYEPPADAILVVETLDPAWTLSFRRLKGVVVERGGLLSHGAIIARELGIPCVCLPGARARFREGERIEIDGERGGASSVGGR